MSETKAIPKLDLVKIDHEELIFIRKYAPKAFARTITDSLANDGYEANRYKVHNELNTLKDEYDLKVINKARELLKALTGREFQK